MQIKLDQVSRYHHAGGYIYMNNLLTPNAFRDILFLFQGCKSLPSAMLS